jgi:quercetin dioxygenase-like cupin family protein
VSRTCELIAVALVASVAAAQTPPPGITRRVLIDNGTVLVAQLQMAPGSQENIHTHPFSAVVVQATVGEVDMRLGDQRATGTRPVGFTDFVGAGVPHAAANMGHAPFAVVTIALKPERIRANSVPAREAPPGITRTTVVDNEDVRAVRVVFAPAAREPVHTHPFDLVLVQLLPGDMELQVGDKRTVRKYEAGEALFLPREIPHAVASADSGQFELMSVAIKD